MTEHSQVPIGWITKPLNDLVDFLNSQRRPIKSADRSHMRGQYPYYGASGIIDWVNDYLFDEELILLGEDGENILSRNLPLAFRVSGKVWVNNHAHVFRPKRGVVDIRFVTELLEFQDYADLNSGTAQPKLNKASCKALQLTYPEDLKEQEAIAEALSDADALIEGLERLIAKKRLIKQGAMQDLLTAKRRLPGFSGEWSETSFGQCFQFLRTGSASRSQLGVNLGVGYIHYGDIHGMKSLMLDTSVTRLPEIADGQVATLSRVQDGDLVIADASEDLTDVGKSVEVRGVGDKQIVAGLHTFLLREIRKSLQTVSKPTFSS